MDALKNIFEVHAMETGIFIVILCKIVIIIQFFISNNTDEKKSRKITFKSFFKNWLFLILMLFYGLSLIFRNL